MQIMHSTQEVLWRATTMPTAVLEREETKKKQTEQKNVYRAPIALYENDESYIVFVQMPGVDEKSVQVRLDKGVMTIEAKLAVELPPAVNAKYSEVSLGDYRRTLDLGDQIDEEKIEASFKSGILKLTMQKSKTAKYRKIPVKSA
jgi:HSP20 family molecular chaperone IbpA